MLWVVPMMLMLVAMLVGEGEAAFVALVAMLAMLVKEGATCTCCTDT